MAGVGGHQVVDVALTLMAEQGFDATSMEQIAAAAGVPLDGVVQTFETTDAIVFTVVDDMLAAVVSALDEIGTQVPIPHALLTAHSKVVADIVAGNGPVSSERMRHMGIAIMSSTTLQKTATAHRAQVLSVAVADRLGVAVDDKQVQHELKLWSAVVAGTYMGALDRRGHFDPEIDAKRPENMRDRLNRTYRLVTGRRPGRNLNQPNTTEPEHH